MSAGIFSAARPAPGRLVPAVAAVAVLLLALPVFAVAGWPLRAWALAAILWIAAQVFALMLARLPRDADDLAAVGMRGIGTALRAFLVGIPLVVATMSDERLGITAALLYTLAFTVELLVGVVSYLGGGVRP